MIAIGQPPFVKIIRYFYLFDELGAISSFLGVLFRFFLFIENAVNIFGTEAAGTGNAQGRFGIARFPAVRQVRLAQVGTAHGHEGQVCRFQRVFDIFDLAETADDADIDFAFQHGCGFSSVGFEIHRFLCAADSPDGALARQGRCVAATDFDGVDAGVGQPGHDLLAFFKGQAAVFHEIGTVQFDPDRIIGADGLAHGGDTFQEEAGPVFQAAAVGIGAGVEMGRQELAGQVAVGAVELDAVETGGLGSGSGFGDGFRQLMDLIDCQGLRFLGPLGD